MSVSDRFSWLAALVSSANIIQIQPVILPRPDLKALGVNYRRIPVLAIGRDIYCDTRLQLKALEAHFPASAKNPSLSLPTPEHAAICALFERWAIDGGLFGRGALLIPADGDFLKNPKVQKDRGDFSNSSWSADTLNRARPEAMANVRDVFVLLEDSLLKDGRKWIVNTANPTLADIEGRLLLLS